MGCYCAETGDQSYIWVETHLACVFLNQNLFIVKETLYNEIIVYFSQWKNGYKKYTNIKKQAYKDKYALKKKRTSSAGHNRSRPS